MRKWAKRAAVLPTLGLGLVACGGAVTGVAPEEPPNVGSPDGGAVDWGGGAQSDGSVDRGGDGGSAIGDATSSGDAADAPVGTDAAADDAAGTDAAAEGAASGDAAGQPIPCAETTTCATAVRLGTVIADVNDQPNSYVSALGNRAEWLVVEAITSPTYNTSRTMAVQVSVTPPADEDFNLEVYLSDSDSAPECTRVFGSSNNGPGKNDVIGVGWPESIGTSSNRWITIHVTGPTSATCNSGDQWKLELRGGFH